MDSNVKKVLQNFDIFGQSFSFYEDRSSSYKTYFGMFFTFLLYISVLTFSIWFGQEIYQRKSPLVNNYFEVLTNSSLHLNDFPIIFSVRDLNRIVIKDLLSIYDLEVHYFHAS